MTSIAHGSAELADGAVLIYDGECPVCANYVAFAEVRRKVPGIRLVSARQGDDPAVSAAWRHGFDLDREMLLLLDGRWFSGAAAIVKLAELGTTGMRERLLRRFLGSTAGRERRYRVLVAGRKLLLRLLGRSDIRPPS